MFIMLFIILNNKELFKSLFRLLISITLSEYSSEKQYLISKLHMFILIFLSIFIKRYSIYIVIKP